MIGRRSLVTMRPGSASAAEAAAAEASQAAAAAMNRADASMRVANTARSTANDATNKLTDLEALAATVQERTAASESDRASLHAKAANLLVQINALVSSVAGKASAESLSTTTSTLSNLTGQVSALATSVAGKVSQSAVDGLAASVGAVQSGLSSLAARVSALESRAVPTVQRVRVTDLPAIALLATFDKSITWPTPFPSANYSIKPTIEGPAGLGSLTASVKSQTALGCVVTVRAGVAVTANQVLDVVAIHT